MPEHFDPHDPLAWVELEALDPTTAPAHRSRRRITRTTGYEALERGIVLLSERRARSLLARVEPALAALEEI